VKYNKALNEVLSELKKDQVLNSKVKMYREELINYRSTYEMGAESTISFIR
jgi:hypothetical protein